MLIVSVVGCAWSPVPLAVRASHFRSLWNDDFCDVEHVDRLLPRLDVKLEYDLLFLQPFLVIAQLGLLTDEDDGFPILLDLERAFAVSDQEREVEHVLDRLRKVARV